MSDSKRPKKDRVMSEIPITFEYQMSVRGDCLKQATVIPPGCCTARKYGVPLHTCVAKNAVVVRDGVGSSTLVYAVEKGLYAPQA